MTSDDARALRMLCLGVGINFPFATSAVAAGKGLLPSSSSFTYTSAGRSSFSSAIGIGNAKYKTGAGALVGPGGCTLNYWTQKSASFATTNMTLGIVADASNTLYSSQTTATNIALGQNASNLVATPAWGAASSWHMVTAVYRFNPISGLAVRSLYFDGALAASDSPTFTTAQQAIFQSMDIVSCFGQTDTKLADALVLPYPLGATMVSQLYTTSLLQLFSNLPQVFLDGEALNDGSITCLGTASQFAAAYTPCFIAGTYRTDAQSLSVTMEEV